MVARLWVRVAVAFVIGSAGLPAQRFVEARVRHLPRSDTAAEVTAVDFEADGDLDLFALDGTLWENDGQGEFRLHPAGSILPIVGTGQSYQLGDIDGDGLVDAIAWSNPSRLSYRTASGGFAPPVTAPAGDAFATLIDIDGEGDLDALTRTAMFRNDAGVWVDVTSQRGSPSFRRFGALPRILAVDLDRDGDLDVLTPGAELWANDGAGNFTDLGATLPIGLLAVPYVPFFCADADGDGLLDLLGGYFEYPTYRPRLLFLRNLGALRFADVSAAPPQGDVLWESLMDRECTVGDADGDGSADVWHPGVGIWRGNGRGMYLLDPSPWIPKSVANPPRRPLLFDADGDGDLDLLIDRQRLLFNDGRGHLSPDDDMGPRFADSSDRTTVVDLDGDGDLDIVADPQRILINDGNGRFTPKPLSALPPFPGAAMTSRPGVIGVADFDGDNRPDLFLNNDRLRLWLNDGRGGFRDATSLLPVIVSNTMTRVLVGDLDGDGDNDILVDAFVTGQLDFLRNDGATFTVIGLYLHYPTSLIYPMALADFDGDGDLDLLTTHNLPGGSVYLNGGTGMFSLPQPGDAQGFVGEQNVIDFDGDGDLDVVGENDWHFGRIPCAISLYENDGAGHLTERVLADQTAGTPLLHPFVADIDGDGDLDVGAGVGPNGPTWYENRGGFPFRIVLGAQSDGSSLQGVSADIDLDGDPDLITPTRIVINRLRQVEMPLLARIGQPFRIEVSAMPSPPVAGSRAVIWVGPRALATPVRLAGLGTLRIDLAAAILLGPVPVGAARPAVFDLPIPNRPALVGATIHAQALILGSPAAWSLDLTNLASRTVVR